MKAENNPFRSSRIEAIRYRIDDGLKQDLVAKLSANRWRGCLLGPEGSGKTTLLEDLEPWIAASGRKPFWVRLSLDSPPQDLVQALRAICSAASETCCLLDGGEVLGWFRWLQILRSTKSRGVGLLATCHLRCLLPVIFETRPDPNTALALVRGLAGVHWNVDLAFTAEQAFLESGGNVREVFRACYHHCSRL